MSNLYDETNYRWKSEEIMEATYKLLISISKLVFVNYKINKKN